MSDYFNSSDNKEEGKRTSEAITNRIHSEFSNLFSVVESLQVKEGSHSYGVPPRKVAYVLQKPLKEELEGLQKQQIIVPLGVNETSEWCNSFVLVPKLKEEAGVAKIQHD